MRSSLVLVVLTILIVAGCGGSAIQADPGSSPATTSASAGSVAASGGHGLAFAVQVSFTGAVEVHGSFVDTYTGSGFSSCAAYADAPLWRSPGAVTGTERIGGVPVSFDFALPPGDFSGPGTYAPGVMGRLTIGAARFVGTESSVTVKDDGSGRGSFSNFKPEGPTAGAGSESGTVSWSCSP